MIQSITTLQNEVLGMFNHVLTNESKDSVKNYLNTIMSNSRFPLAIDIAKTLYARVVSYSNPYCSDKQAYVIAREVIERKIKVTRGESENKEKVIKEPEQQKEANKIAYSTLYLTQDELNSKKKELSALQKEFERENNRLHKADGMTRLVGADFDETMLNLARLEQKIEQLKYLICNAHIVSGQKQDVVGVLSKVRIKDLKTHNIIEAKIVRENDSDAILGSSISCASPVGRSLIGHSVNDTVCVTLNGVKKNYHILSVA